MPRPTIPNGGHREDAPQANQLGPVEVPVDASVRSISRRQQLKSKRYKWNVSHLYLKGKFSSYVAFVSSHNMNLFKKHYQWESVAALAADIAKGIAQGRQCLERLNFPGQTVEDFPVDIRLAALRIREELIAQGARKEESIAKTKDLVVRALRHVAENICEYTSNHQVPVSISGDMLSRVVRSQGCIDTALSQLEADVFKLDGHDANSTRVCAVKSLSQSAMENESDAGPSDETITANLSGTPEKCQVDSGDVGKHQRLPAKHGTDVGSISPREFVENVDLNDAQNCAPSTSTPTFGCRNHEWLGNGPEGRDPRKRFKATVGAVKQRAKDPDRPKNRTEGTIRGQRKTAEAFLSHATMLGDNVATRKVACSYRTLCFVYLRQEALYRVMNLEKMIKSYGWNLSMAGLNLLGGAVVLVSRPDGLRMRRIKSWCLETMNVELEDGTKVSPFELANHVLEPGKRATEFVIQEYNCRIHAGEIEGFGAQEVLGVFYRLLCCALAVRKLSSTQNPPRLIKNLVQKLIAGPPEKFFEEFGEFLHARNGEWEQRDARDYGETIKKAGENMTVVYRSWYADSSGTAIDLEDEINVEDDLGLYSANLRRHRPERPSCTQASERHSELSTQEDQACRMHNTERDLPSPGVNGNRLGSPVACTGVDDCRQIGTATNRQSLDTEGTLDALDCGPPCPPVNEATSRKGGLKRKRSGGLHQKPSKGRKTLRSGLHIRLKAVRKAYMSLDGVRDALRTVLQTLE